MEQVRLLRHPGRMLRRRVESAECSGAASYRLRLREGVSLHDGITSALVLHGVRSAALNMFGGLFHVFNYCLARPLAGRNEVAAYTTPIEVRGQIRVLSATGTFGMDEADQPLLHIHGVVLDNGGHLIGGHILPTHTIAASPSPDIYVRAFSNVSVFRSYDAETFVSVFRPTMITELDHAQ